MLRSAAKLTIFLILAGLTVFSSISYAETAPEIQTKIDAFFQQLVKGEVQPAIQKIIEGSLIGNNPAQITNLISQINNAINLYGPLIGAEHVKTSTSAQSLCKVIAISKHAGYALKWTFLYYNGTTGWVLLNIEFNDDIESLFKE